MTVEPEACPYLGLPDDPRTRFTFATPAHRCHVKGKPNKVDLGQQGAYCLTSEFPSCKWYRAPAPARGAKAVPVVAASAAVVAPPEPVAEPAALAPPPPVVVAAAAEISTTAAPSPSSRRPLPSLSRRSPNRSRPNLSSPRPLRSRR